FLRRHVIRKGENPDADDAAEGPVEGGPFVVPLLLSRLSCLQQIVGLRQVHTDQPGPLFLRSLDCLDVQHHFHGSKDFHMMIASWLVLSFVSTAQGRTASSEKPFLLHRRWLTRFSVQSRFE